MDGGRWPLVGRDAEYEVITAALAEDPVRSIVLAGPAGAGRTRLAQEALALAERSGRPTRWAAGTSAAALVPLGALAHLFPTVDAASDPLVLLQRATLAIAGDGSGPAPVVGIDDVHLLDQLSITLLHQLAVRNAVTLVLTVRTDNAAPDPAVPLWKDGLATRIELHPLCRADSDGLISEVLGDDVETRTGERLWRLTRGNPMYLREVLEDGQRTGRLQQSGGLWRWEGAMNPSQRLGELVLAELGDLEADEWRALEVLATTEPVDGHRLLELSSPQAVASLERRGVVVEDVAGRSGQLRAAHPVYTAVV